MKPVASPSLPPSNPFQPSVMDSVVLWMRVRAVMARGTRNEMEIEISQLNQIINYELCDTQPKSSDNGVNYATQSKTAVCTFLITRIVFSFALGKILNKLADDQCSSITESSIYYIKHMCIYNLKLLA